MSSNIFEQKTATTGPLTKACPYLKYKVNGQNFIVIANFFVNIYVKIQNVYKTDDKFYC